MAGLLHAFKVSNSRQSSTFRFYLQTRLMANVLLTVAIISGTYYFAVSLALKAQFLARAQAEKNLSEEIIRDRLRGIEKRLRETVNNNTVKITLMLGVKPQLKELLRDICPPADGAHYFVKGGPDNEFFPETPKALIQLIQTTGSHNFEAKPYLIPEKWTLIFSKSINRNDETIGTAYCVYNMSQDDFLENQLQQIGNNWFYFQVPGGLKRLDNFFREDSHHSHLAGQHNFAPYAWGGIAGVTSRSYLFESLYYFVSTQSLDEMKTRIIYLVGSLSLLLWALTQLLAILLTRRLSAPLKQMAATAHAISLGEKRNGFDLTGKQFIEFYHLSQTFNSMLQQLQVAQDNARFKEMFDHVTDVLWIQDNEGKIIETNEFGFKVLGYTCGELRGLKVDHICFPENPSRVVKDLQEQGEASYIEYRQDRNGRKIPFEVKARKIVYRNTSCILTVARDITTLREAEEFIREQNLILEDMVAKRTAALSKALVDLEEAKLSSETANRAKSQFLANMSHEIRTPIHGVLGIIDLLFHTKLTEEQHQLLENARKSGEMLIVLVNDIMDLSRIEASKLVLEDIPFDLLKLVEEVVELAGAEVHIKGLKMSCLITTDMHAMLLGDPVRVRQILHNLLNNAIKFTASGEIIVRVNCVQELADGVEILIEVQDSGIGISSEVQEVIFDPFCQGDGSMTRKFGGAGLGLAIVKNLVMAMGGSVGVVSKLSQGSTFWFSIPFKKDVSPQPGKLVNRNDGPHCLPVLPGEEIVDLPFRILLAEDNFINQRVTTKMLSHIGCLVVDVVSNGLQAMEALTHKHYDLILMDCQMPEMDGYEASRNIRVRETISTQASHLPIIALTGHAMDGDRDRCLAAGMDDFLPKPFNIKQLWEILNKWLNLPNHY